MQVQNYVIYRTRQPDHHVAQIAGALVNGLRLDAPVQAHQRAHLVHASSFWFNTFYGPPIVKLTRATYADSFFRTGQLQLGSFAGFRDHEHPAVRDSEEGRFLLVGRNARFTGYATIGGGFNHWAFCCRHGVPDAQALAKHGYDAAILIKHPWGFATAVQRKLDADRFWSAPCRYSPHKVIVDSVGSSFQFHRLSHHTLGLAGAAKYFVKPSHFGWQNEFRFLWRVREDVTGFDRFDVPDARVCCERLF